MSKILLKGTTASLGIVKGAVKVLRNPLYQYKVKKKDILVIEMTDPLYMQSIMKSGGIITNIGGVLSHAAIISREFKIPCVVGTGNATEILKDGQIVVLDATKGEIRDE